MDTIGDRIKKQRKSLDLTQEELGTKIGVTKSSVSQWESGMTKSLTGKNLTGLAEALGVTEKWLVTGKGEKLAFTREEIDKLRGGLDSVDALGNKKKIESNATWIGGFDLWDENTLLNDDEVALPFFREVELAAGSGRYEVVENHGPKLRFAKSTLKKQGVSPANAACVIVSGNSMEPAIPDGATIGIDTSNTTIKNGDIYAIDHDGHLRVKLVYRMPGDVVRLRSFNSDEWPDEHYTGEDAAKIKVIGRVFWWSVLR